MSITTITKKGQVTIPAKVRRTLFLKEKDKVSIRAEGKKAVIEKVPPLLKLQGSVKAASRVQKLTWKEIEKKAHKAQARRAVK